jgi:ATP-binding cassette subfamily B protein
LGALTFLIWAFESFFQYLYSLSWRNLAQTVEHKVRMDCYQHIQNAPLPIIEKNQTGQLISILNDDINQLERFL